MDLPDFTDLLTEPKKRECRNHCVLQAPMAALSPEQREIVRAAFATPKEQLQHEELARRLTMRGLSLSGFGVGRHRDGKCKCCVAHGTLG